MKAAWLTNLIYLIWYSYRMDLPMLDPGWLLTLVFVPVDQRIVGLVGTRVLLFFVWSQYRRSQNSFNRIHRKAFLDHGFRYVSIVSCKMSLESDQSIVSGMYIGGPWPHSGSWCPWCYGQTLRSSSLSGMIYWIHWVVAQYWRIHQWMI